MRTGKSARKMAMSFGEPGCAGVAQDTRCELTSLHQIPLHHILGREYFRHRLKHCVTDCNLTTLEIVTAFRFCQDEGLQQGDFLKFCDIPTWLGAVPSLGRLFGME